MLFFGGDVTDQVSQLTSCPSHNPTPTPKLKQETGASTHLLNVEALELRTTALLGGV